MSGNGSPENPATGTNESADGPPEGVPGEGPPEGVPGEGPPGDEPACLCPLGGVMDLLSKKYAMQVVCAVGALGPVRYGRIDATFGEVSSSTLSTRLEELTDAGLLARTRYDETPPRVEYELTDEGDALAERLEPLLEWAEGRDE